MLARFRRLITILAALALSMSFVAPVVASPASFVIQIQPTATLLHDNTKVEVHITYTCTFPEGGLSSAEEDYSGFGGSVTQGAVFGAVGAGAFYLTCDGTSQSSGFTIPSGTGLWTAGQATFTFFVQFTEAVSHDVFRLDVPNYSITLTPATPFTDIAASPFKSDIEWVYLAEITSGCTATLYCPNGFVTRAQMASFLARALHLSGSAPDAFTDDETSIHEPNINLVAKAGIASGCAVNKFCPDGLVSREQMASFLARALHLSGVAPDAFTDDETSIHEPNINLVAREGITSGCTLTTYCPTANVTRGQMAAFLHRAFAP